MLSRRNHAYRVAYGVLFAVVLTPVVALWIAPGTSDRAFVLESRHLAAIAWLVLGTGIGLPSAVLAVAEDEI